MQYELYRFSVTQVPKIYIQLTDSAKPLAYTWKHFCSGFRESDVFVQYCNTAEPPYECQTIADVYSALHWWKFLPDLLKVWQPFLCTALANYSFSNFMGSDNRTVNSKLYIIKHPFSVPLWVLYHSDVLRPVIYRAGIRWLKNCNAQMDKFIAHVQMPKSGMRKE